MSNNNLPDTMLDSPMEVEAAEESTSAIVKQNTSRISEMESRIHRLERSGVFG